MQYQQRMKTVSHLPLLTSRKGGTHTPDREYFRQRLEEARDETLAHLAMLRAGLEQTQGAAIAELSVYDNHPGDVGSETFERGKDLALRDMLSLRLEKIEAARERLEKGNYGRCQRCGRPIAPGRLAVEPEATYCLECQARVEREDRWRGRPAEEDVLNPPFPRPDYDKQAGYDDEDAWQEVARWNEHAEGSGAGSYYGDNSAAEEDRGTVEAVDEIPSYRDDDTGMFYEDKD